MDMTKFIAFATCELNYAKRDPANARLYKIRCCAMFDLMQYMSGNHNLIDTWETVYQPAFLEMENAYLKGVFPDENN